VKHVGALKRVLRYLVGTSEQGILYKRGSGRRQELTLSGFCDSDWGSDPETRKSTSGFVFMLAGGAVAWMSKRQSIIAQSTAEAEYVAACEAAMEAKGQFNILSEILPTTHVRPVIGIDNSAVAKRGARNCCSAKARQVPAAFTRRNEVRGLVSRCWC
jgi:hypothetical protein